MIMRENAEKESNRVYGTGGHEDNFPSGCDQECAHLPCVHGQLRMSLVCENGL